MDSENNLITYSHWGFEVKIITLIVLGILGGTIFFVLKGHQQFYIKLLMCVFILTAIITSVCFTPRYIKIDNKYLIIKKMYGQVSIPIANISEVQLIDSKIVSRSIRSFGSGGFFGYLGKFYNLELGNYSIYATERKNLIFISTNNKRYVINCTNSDKLINCIESHIKQDSEV